MSHLSILRHPHTDVARVINSRYIKHVQSIKFVNHKCKPVKSVCKDFKIKIPQHICILKVKVVDFSSSSANTIKDTGLNNTFSNVIRSTHFMLNCFLPLYYKCWLFCWIYGFYFNFKFLLFIFLVQVIIYCGWFSVYVLYIFK